MLLKITLVTVQAEVDGQKITWLAPHARQQVLTDDVDFNVMLTFLEFYEVTCLSPVYPSLCIQMHNLFH